MPGMIRLGLAFFHFLTQPVGNQMVAEFTPPRLRGLGYGIYFFMTFGAGSAGAMLSGWVSDKVGLAKMFPALAAVLVPGIIAMLFLALIVRGETGAAKAAEDEPEMML